MLVRYEVEFDDVAVGGADVRRDRCEGGVVLPRVDPAPGGVHIGHLRGNGAAEFAGGVAHGAEGGQVAGGVDVGVEGDEVVGGGDGPGEVVLVGLGGALGLGRGQGGIAQGPFLGAQGGYGAGRRGGGPGGGGVGGDLSVVIIKNYIFL